MEIRGGHQKILLNSITVIQVLYSPVYAAFLDLIMMEKNRFFLKRCFFAFGTFPVFSFPDVTCFLAASFLITILHSILDFSQLDFRLFFRHFMFYESLR